MNHLPMRGDGVETWLEAQVDLYGVGDARDAMQDALDEYHRMADAGEPMLVNAP